MSSAATGLGYCCLINHVFSAQKRETARACNVAPTLKPALIDCEHRSLTIRIAIGDSLAATAAAAD